MKSILKRTLLPVILVLIVSLTSCSKSRKYPTFIPKNAGIVAIINGESISEKSGISDPTATHIYNALKNKLSKEEVGTLNEFEPIIKNSDESGIDLKSDIHMFSFMKEDVSYAAIHLNLLDKSKFERFIGKVIKKSGKAIPITNLDGYSYFSPGKKAPIIMWNQKQLFVFIDPRHHNDVATDANMAKQLLSEDKSESIVSTHQLDDLFKNKKDISVWVNYGYLINKMNQVNRMRYPVLQSQLSSNLMGKTFTSYCDFQVGQVVFSFRTNLDEKTKKLLEENKIINDKFNTEFLKYFPQKSYINFFGSVNMPGYYHFLTQSLAAYKANLNQVDNIFQAALGMSLQDALSEFSGEMGFDIYGFKFVKAKKDFKGTDSIPKPLFAVGIGFKSDTFVNTLLNKFGAMLDHENGYYAIKKGKSSIYFNLFDKNLIASNDLNLIKDIASGALKDHSLANSKVAEKLEEHSIFASIDLNLDNYPGEFKNMIKEKAGKNADAIFNMVSVYDKVEYYPVSKYDWRVVLKLRDHKSNSLKVLFSSIDNNVDSIR